MEDRPCPTTIEHSLTFPPDLNVHAGRVTGRVRCGACDWTAVMTDDTRPAVQTFLTDRLIAHVMLLHNPEEI